MVKKVNFGGVSAVLRYKLFISLFLFSTLGCAASFEKNFEAYAKKIEECNQIAQSNSLDFPITSWFESLESKDQKMVILYLSIDNRDNCSKAEREALKATEYQLSPQQQKLFDDIGATTDPKHISYVKGLDLNEIDKIQSAYKLPFDSIKVGQRLGLLK